MPIHDWTKVKAGILHAFHLEWISKIAHVLNHGLLPSSYYALAEQFASGYNADVLTLNGTGEHDGVADDSSRDDDGQKGGVLTAPKLKPIAKTELEFYRRKQKVIAVRTESDDELVAVIEVVSSGNKAAAKPFRAFVEKAADLLDKGIHLLVLDLYPPGKRDPNGIHGAIWQEVSGQDYVAPNDKPLTMAAYETAGAVQAYVVPVGVGDTLPDMPLFIEPQRTVTVPLEATYNAAYEEVPRRWQQVLDKPSA